MRRVRSPQGQTSTKPMKAMLQRAVVKDETGQGPQGTVDRHLRRGRVKLVAAGQRRRWLGARRAPRRRVPLTAASTVWRRHPRAPVTWPLVFRWEGAAPSDVVRVHIFDDAERPIFGMEVRGSSLDAPKSLRSQLFPGARYQWRVARVDENGDECDASELTAFQLQ